MLVNGKTKHFDNRKSLKFPEQYQVSRGEGANHLFDGKVDTPGVDLDKEFMPAGQVVGSIGHLLPARVIVHSMVREARLCARQLAANLEGVREHAYGAKL